MTDPITAATTAISATELALKLKDKLRKAKPSIKVEITLEKWESRDTTKLPHPEVFVFAAFNGGDKTALDSYGILVKDASEEKVLPDIYPLGSAKYYLDEAWFPKKVKILQRTIPA